MWNENICLELSNFEIRKLTEKEKSIKRPIMKTEAWVFQKKIILVWFELHCYSSIYYIVWYWQIASN